MILFHEGNRFDAKPGRSDQCRVYPPGSVARSQNHSPPGAMAVALQFSQQVTYFPFFENDKQGNKNKNQPQRWAQRYGPD